MSHDNQRLSCFSKEPYVSLGGGGGFCGCMAMHQRVQGRTGLIREILLLDFSV